MKANNVTLQHPDPGTPFTPDMVREYYQNRPTLDIGETVKRLNLFVKYGPAVHALKAALGDDDGATVVYTAYMFKDKMPPEYRNPRWDTMKKDSKEKRAVTQALEKQQQKHDRKVARLQTKLDLQPKAQVPIDQASVIEEIIQKLSEYDKLSSAHDLLTQERNTLRDRITELEDEAKELNALREQLRNLLA